MNLGGEIESTVMAAAASGGVALALALVWRWLFGQRPAARYAAAIALAVGMAVGWVLLNGDEALTPKRHWQWLPYLTLAAAIVGPAALAQGLSWLERLCLYALLAVAAAWLVVPTWTSLSPPRSTYIPLVACYVVSLAMSLGPLPRRVAPSVFMWSLFLSSAAVAMAVAAAVSLSYGGQAATASGALAGCWLASLAGALHDEARGAVLPFIVSVGGMAFVGAIEPKLPLVGLFALPIAPVVLWVFAAPPLNRLSSWSAAIAQSVAVALTLSVGVAACFVGR